jgi:phenylalanyl-tRNA synthetase beta chain
VPAERAGFARGACGQVFWGGEPIGYIGMLDRPTADLVDLRHLPAIADVELEPLLDAYQPVPVMKPLSRFPAVRRDVSLQVDEAVRYEQLESLVRELKLAHLEALEHAATYRGKPLPAGQKSVTLTLVFRKAEGTLTREEADAAVSRVVQLAGERLGAILRS